MRLLLARAKEFDLGSTATYRLLGLVLSLAANALIIVLLTKQFGANAYAAFTLVASLINLLPFADLGLGASVVNATSDNMVGKIPFEEYRRLVSRARDLLTIVALLVVISIYCIAYFDILESFLGNLSSSPGIISGAIYTLACIAVSIPFGIGARRLQGLGRMVDVVRIGIIGPGIQIMIIVPLWLFNAPVAAYFYGPGTAYVAMAVTGYWIAHRRSGIRLYPVGEVIFRRLGVRQRLWHTAAPFLVVSVGMAAGFQSHRLILAQFGTPEDVAEYSLVAQFLGPLLAITGVVGQNLWSRYRSQLGTVNLNISIFRSHILIFSILGVFFSFGLVCLIPVAADLLTGGIVLPHLLVSVSAGAYLIISSIHQPSAMLLNDSKGLWFQSICVILVAIGTVSFTLLSLDWLGAAAPYLSMVVCMIFLQVIPSIIVSVLKIDAHK